MNAQPAFFHWLDNYTPASIRNNHDLSRSTQVRTRAMVAVLILSIILPLIVLTVYTALHIFTDYNFAHDIAVLIAVEVILISQHVYFQSYGNLRVTAAAYSTQFLVCNTYVIFFSGGWAGSPIFVMLICSPLIAFMTIGYRAALLHVGLIFMIMLTLLLMHLNSIELTNLGRPENFHISRMIAWGMTLAILTLFLMVNEQLLQAENR